MFDLVLMVTAERSLMAPACHSHSTFFLNSAGPCFIAATGAFIHPPGFSYAADIPYSWCFCLLWQY